MSENEKANLLSLVPQSNVQSDQPDAGIKVQSPLDRMQQFLETVHSNSYLFLGTIGPSLGKDFYQIPQLGLALINSLFSNLEVNIVHVEFISSSQ